MSLLLAAALAAVPARSQTLTLDAPRRPRVPHGAFLRSPSLELFGLREAEAFSGPAQGLTDAEKLKARVYFGGSLDLDAVRIVTAKTGTDDAMTLGNVIRVPASVHLRDGTLMHELVHVWQYQTSGTDYISDSLLHQACSFARTWDRNGAYRYKLVSGKSFLAYTVEQQAQIIEDLADGPKPELRADYERLAAEMRSIKAFSPSTVFAEEAGAGLSPRELSLPPSPGQTFFNEGAGVPQLEVRFW